ncbi:MAG: hypothetical protein HOY78_04810 [Saccharothrix sp.]|nr:hypothetical protein [Saccharothrix sp.]
MSQATFYWHNGRSLGHTYESAKLIRAVLDEAPELRVSAVTGAFRGIETLPPACDLFKVPGFRNFDGTPDYRPEALLDLPYGDLLGLRSRLISEYAQRVRPDVFVVNHELRGYEGELVETLSALPPSTLRVLTLRGVLFDVPNTKAEFFEGDSARFLLDHYDRIHVNIDPDVFDLADYYGVPSEIADLLHYAGYPDDPYRLSKDDARQRVGVTGDGKVMVVAMGGGQGAWHLWQEFFTALSTLRRVGQVLVVPGPYLEVEHQAALDALARADGRVRVLRRVADLKPLMCAADLFVGAAGASTISEVLATGVNALLVARQQVEKEQEIHSQLLAGRGLVRALRLTEWTSRRLREDLAEALENPIVGTLPPLLGGASRSARMLVGAFREQHSTTHAGTR